MAIREFDRPESPTIKASDRIRPRQSCTAYSVLRMYSNRPMVNAEGASPLMHCIARGLTISGCGYNARSHGGSPRFPTLVPAWMSTRSWREFAMAILPSRWRRYRSRHPAPTEAGRLLGLRVFGAKMGPVGRCAPCSGYVDSFRFVDVRCSGWRRVHVGPRGRHDLGKSFSFLAGGASGNCA